jgi:F0F1-type ATP synthase epsilon subunit
VHYKYGLTKRKNGGGKFKAECYYLCMEKPALLEVEVIAPTTGRETYRASSVSSINDKGRFDIMPHHANFISLIKGFLTIRTTTGDRSLKITTGVLYCSQDKIRIFVES